MVEYRRDIDGLRALAVVPVVLFHAGIPQLSGGFVGVDVFFVISGYLITRQLLASEAVDLRSIVTFYERRLRRIAPALVALIAFLLLVTIATMPSVDTLRTSKNALAALLFAANIRFHSMTGYFDVAADEEPLLHTWSLAVEEQFYLGFPLLLILLHKVGKGWIAPALAVLAIASFFLSVMTVPGSPSSAFYLLPSRAWELLAGAILASAPQVAAPPLYRQSMAAAGLLLITVPMAAYDAFTPFPGAAALPPVCGTVLLIAAGERTLVGRMLSTAPLVWVGLISYSLYLWHWPIFVLSSQLIGRPSPTVMAVLVAASFVAAYLSYRFVERPFRNRTKFSSRRVAGMTGAGAFAAAACSVGLIMAGGWPERSPAAERWQQTATAREMAFQNNPCLARGAVLPPVAPCLLGVQGDKSVGVLWGDSHAAHWAPLVDAVAAERGLSFRQLTKAGCPPVPAGFMLPSDASRRDCPDFNARALEYIKGEQSIRYVLLAANWQGITEGALSVGDARAASDLEMSRAYAASSLARLAQQLRASGKVVLAIGQTPIPDENAILCVGRRRFMGTDERSCSESSRELAESRDREARKLLAGVSDKEPGSVLSPLNRFCDRDACYAIDKGEVLYIDAAHLAPSGALRMRSELSDLLAASR